METLQRTANRGSVSTGYDIERSVKLQRTSEYFIKDTTQGDQQKWTFSTWVKRSNLSNSTDQYMNIWSAGKATSNYCHIYFRGDSSYPTNRIFIYLDNGGTQFFLGATSRSFRDTASWYHILLATDTTQGTDSNRNKFYVNGVQETLVGVSGAAAGFSTQNASTRVNDNGGRMSVGNLDSTTNSFNGYMAETILLDGTQASPTSFGKFDDNGTWVPIDPSGLTFGSKGFWLEYKTLNNMGADSSGGSNGFSVQNINQGDSATDSPTNNFSILNALHYYSGVYTSPMQGGTEIEIQSAAWKTFVSTIAVSSGKWYVEFEAGTATTFCGVSDVSEVTGVQQNQNYLGNWDKSIGFYGIAGLLFIDGATSTWSGLAYGDGDKIGIALDKDNGYVYMSKNGVYANSGNPTSGSSGTGGVALTTGNAAYQASDQYVIGMSVQPANATTYANYGGFTTMTISSAASDGNGYGNFEYAPPSGYFALCTKNLAEHG